MDVARLSGRRLVVGIYVAMVALAGLLGAILGAVVLPARVGGDLPEAAFGPLTFPITPVTFALFGMVTVGVGLGVALLAVAAASRRAA